MYLLTKLHITYPAIILIIYVKIQRGSVVPRVQLRVIKATYLYIPRILYKKTSKILIYLYRELLIVQHINTYCKKVVKPNVEEIQLHKNYLKTNLKKNFFN